jgi:hypothetical protein
MNAARGTARANDSDPRTGTNRQFIRTISSLREPEFHASTTSSFHSPLFAKPSHSL